MVSDPGAVLGEERAMEKQQQRKERTKPCRSQCPSSWPPKMTIHNAWPLNSSLVCNCFLGRDAIPTYIKNCSRVAL